MAKKPNPFAKGGRTCPDCGKPMAQCKCDMDMKGGKGGKRKMPPPFAKKKK